MCKLQKTTKRQYKLFKRTFVQWQFLFGLQEYAVYFDHCPMDTCATCSTDAHNCVATVKFTDRVPEGEAGEWVEDTAKHEALHLLLARYRHVAESRYIDGDAIEHEEERVVRLLEKLL